MKANTISELSTSMSFNKYQAIVYDKTSMTVPLILLYALSIKLNVNAKNYLSKMASDVKSELLSVVSDDVVGMVSRSVQAKAWGEVLGKDIDYKNTKEAVMVPVSGTSITVPYVLFELIKNEKCNSNVKMAKKYIREKAVLVKEDVDNYAKATGESFSLRGKLSGKIQEVLWLDFLPTEIKDANYKIIESTAIYG